MKVCFAFLVFVACAVTVYGYGAGRAIPIESENFVIELFQKINPSIEYDYSNFLVDLSGHYANCRYIGESRLYELVKRQTPEGESIAAIQDYTFGDRTNRRAVREYLKPAYENWLYSSRNAESYKQQIRVAKKFGCSVRPGCRGQVSFTCLFSPSVGQRERPTRPRTTTIATTRRTTPRIKDDIVIVQRALAFTKEQYKSVESMANKEWDRSHFLENLSGAETDCSMIDRDYWDFNKTKAVAERRGQIIEGTFGYTRKVEDTDKAIESIVFNFMSDMRGTKVGCSVIPDCRRDTYVVVSCLYRMRNTRNGRRRNQVLFRN